MIKIRPEEASILTIIAQSSALGREDLEHLLAGASDDASAIGRYLNDPTLPEPRRELLQAARDLKSWTTRL